MEVGGLVGERTLLSTPPPHKTNNTRRDIDCFEDKMKSKEITLEEELGGAVKRIFDRIKHKVGVSSVLLQVEVVTDGWGPPVVDENVYAEAFPFETPPRVWVEVYPDASDKEITKTLLHELIHIKSPKLSEEETEKKVESMLGAVIK